MSIRTMSQDEMDWIDHVWKGVVDAADEKREKKIVDLYYSYVQAGPKLIEHKDYMACLRDALMAAGEWYEAPSAIDHGWEEYLEIMRLQAAEGE